eukprot:jgi/Mesvir1/14372/Mv09772-RA.1
MMPGFGGDLFRQFFQGGSPFDVFDNDPFFTRGRSAFDSRRFDPFSHDFFNRPFGSPFGSDFGGSLLGPPDGWPRSGRGAPPPLHHDAQAQRPRGHGVTIEEVDDEHGMHLYPSTRGHVQDPDEEHEEGNPHHDRGVHRANGHSHASSASADAYRDGSRYGAGRNERQVGDGHGYNYNRSRVSESSFGVPTYTYSSTYVARMGPGGVAESQHAVSDSATGTHTVEISRSLGDQNRSVKRTRDRQGREHTEESLRNVARGEGHQFDDLWRSKAAESFAGFGSGAIGPGTPAFHAGQERLPQPQLTAAPDAHHAPASVRGTSSGRVPTSSAHYRS